MNLFQSIPIAYWHWHLARSLKAQSSSYERSVSVLALHATILTALGPFIWEVAGAGLIFTVSRDQRWCQSRKLGSWCSLYTGECQCDPDLVVDLTTHCVPPASLGQHCEDDLQCQYRDNNTVCSGHPDYQCDCSHGRISNNGSCVTGEIKY